jgi:hypothetical protein
MTPAVARAAAPTPSRRPLLFALAAAAVSLGFAACTGHAWEDYFITFRASLNLATGQGLVFQPGERVHTFTSPLGTLLPALFALGGGEGVALRALWGLRLVSALALGGAVWLACRAFHRDGIAPVAATAVALAWIVDPKTVDFAMNGMETGLLVFLVVFAWHAVSTGARLWPCALACTGLQWTRPDGCVYFAAIGGAWLLLGAPAAGLAWRPRLVLLGQAIALAVALYLPWFLFSWFYYGSPIPHTILAKAGLSSSSDLVRVLLDSPWHLLVGTVTLHDLFQPAYSFFGGWPEELHWYSRVLALGGALAWLWPRVALPGRLASLAFFLGGFYVNVIPRFPWYHPGWQALAFVTWGYLLHATWQSRPPLAWATGLPRSAVRIAAAVFVLTQAGLFGCVTWQMRVQQELIEDRHRTAIGHWLRAQAQPRDTVFLECLGYIGYYSGLKMLDFPGLSSREVVAARRAGHEKWAQIIAELKPTWLVLRPGDTRQVYADGPDLRAQYQFVRAFDTRAAVDAVGFLPGRGYLNYDSVFLVYRRLAPDAAQR